MKIKFLGMLLFVLMLFPIAMADSDHGNFSEAKELLDQRVSYDQLTDDQFELLGDYFMELVAGDNHEFMDRMMGGEGSENLRQTHINMGKNFYQEYLETGTVQSRGMMGGPMMYGEGMMGSNTMGGVGWFGMGLLWILYVAIIAFVFGIIFWWTYKLINKKKK